MVDDVLWAKVEPLLPRHRQQMSRRGQRPLDDRKALRGILFVLYTGIAWQFLPQGARLRVRHDVLAAVARLAQRRGVGQAAPGAFGRVEHCRETRHVQGGGRRLPHQGAQGRPKTSRSPVDRGKTGSKHHLITDATGVPLAVSLTGGNRHDVTQLMPLADAIPPIRGKPGRPKTKPDELYAERGYNFDCYRDALRDKNIHPRIARRGHEHGSGLGVVRYVVDQTIAVFHAFRRLRIRWETRSDIHEAFMALANCIICHRRLNPQQN